MTGLSDSAVIYLAVMLGVIVVITAMVIPAMLLKKCSGCGRRNLLDATECKHCKQPFPVDDGPNGGRRPLP